MLLVLALACQGETTDCVDCNTSIGTDGTPTRSDTVPDDRAGRCALFCEAALVSCPTDTACLESCNDHCPVGPSEEDVWCAQDAAAAGLACNEFDCWGFCS